MITNQSWQTIRAKDIKIIYGVIGQFLAEQDDFLNDNCPIFAVDYDPQHADFGAA